MMKNKKEAYFIFIDQCDHCPIKKNEQKRGSGKADGECCQRVKAIKSLRVKDSSINVIPECIDTIIESNHVCVECAVMLAFLCAEGAYECFDAIAKSEDRLLLDLLCYKYGNSGSFSLAVMKLFFGENEEGIKQIKKLAADGDQAAKKILKYLK
jgi:hypothetical protein